MTDVSTRSPPSMTATDDQRLRAGDAVVASVKMGEAAEARRGRSFALMEQHPELNPDVDGLGPEAPCSDQVVNTLLELPH